MLLFGKDASWDAARVKKCKIDWKALSRLSCRASVEVRLSIGTAAKPATTNDRIGILA
jgi:hypothetical protein